MKPFTTWLLKAVAAFAVAFLLLSGFCYFYYNLPVHITNKSGATDYLWETNHFSSRGTEGYAATRTDEYGFVNTFPIKKGSVDILVMGSSHGEGFNVGAEENFTYLLNKKLYDNHRDLYAYSICTSGHDLIRCVNNLDTALKIYKPTKYIVMETAGNVFSIDELKQLDAGQITPHKSYDSGMMFYLQKVDYFRLVYSQLYNALNNASQQAIEPVESAPVARTIDLEEYAVYLERMLARASKSAENAGCSLIIMYAPKLAIDYSGNVLPQGNSAQEVLFSELCEKYGITYINMFNDFSEEYNNTLHLPHGFSNTAVGTGHTNKYGHARIAEALYEHIENQR